MERITQDPSICNGRPTIAGTRIAVKTVLDFLAAGDSPSDILEAYPSLELADITAALQYAAKIMDHAFEVKYVA